MANLSIDPIDSLEVSIETPMLEVSIGEPNAMHVALTESVIKESYTAGDWIVIVDNQISVVPTDEIVSGSTGPVTSGAVADALAAITDVSMMVGVSDEFIISDDKILRVNAVDVSKINGIEALFADLPVATTETLGVVMASGAINGVSVDANGVMTVNGIDINRVYQDASTEVVMYGGNSSI